MRACIVLFISALLALLLHVPCPAALPAALPATPPLSVHMEYALSPEDAPKADQRARRLLIAILEPQRGYYAYAHHGGAALPTQAGLAANGRPVETQVRYPAGSPRKDALSGKEIAAYSEPTPLFLTLPEETDGLSLRLSLLLCSSENCIPADLTLPLPPAPDAAGLPSVSATSWAEAWRTAKPGSVLRAAAPTAPLQVVPPRLPSLSLPGIPTRPPVAADWSFKPRPDGSTEPAGLGMALGWGFLAGLLLNIMPCVLPVLTLKMSALLGAGGVRSDVGRLRRFREHNVLFAAGVLSWFALLAGAVSLLDLPWGGLFQYASAVAALAALVGLLGLSMLGLCTLPVIDLKAGVSGSPRSQAYLTGLTATLLATPCSGPLLGGVLAWSVSQPPGIVLLVFLGAGLGMAAPYLAFAAWPSAVALLPRPGPWLLTLERCVGGFLLATTLYLLSILPRDTALMLAGALLVLAVWLTFRLARREGRSRPSVMSLAIIVICGLLTFWVLGRDGASDATHAGGGKVPSGVWEAFTPATFGEALGRDAILLEFTADWCPNCKALELATLRPERLRDWQARYGLRLIRVDMTRRDPEQEALLRALGSISIPLTAIFPPGDAAWRPIVLRDIYTPSTLERSLATLKTSGTHTP